ncbi:MAG: hypothetical protein FJ317_06285 [SAR202 cluster bacterium]|nr:hypothetical protein [SAR202 cluster bacterium]
MVSDFKSSVAVLKAAHAMAAEGSTRAQAREISDRVWNQTETVVDASVVGQVLSRFGIQRRTAHGRSRFVLDPQELATALDALELEAASWESVVARTRERYVKVFEQAEAYEKALAECVAKLQRQQEIANYLAQNKRVDWSVQSSEHEYRRVKERVAYLGKLQAATRELLAKESETNLEELERQKAAVERRVAEIEQRKGVLTKQDKDLVAQETAVAQREQALAGRVAKLQARQEWTTWAEVDEAIDQARRELEEIQRVLGEKRSLADRILGRGKSQ